MKKSIKSVVLASLALALVVPAWSADESFVGKWKAEFDSQVGKQKYTFEFKLEDGKLAGKAIGERQMGTNEVKLVEIKTDKDEISFVEPLTLQGNTVRLRTSMRDIATAVSAAQAGAPITSTSRRHSASEWQTMTHQSL